MIMANVIQCEECGRELQPEDLGVRVTKEGKFLRVCVHCGKEVEVQ